MRNEITSDWETERWPGQNNQSPIEKAQHYAKVLTSGKEKYPLANWIGVVKGQGNNPPKEIQNDGHDISNIPFPRGGPYAERDWVMMASINTLQTYPPVLSPHKPRK